MSWFGLKKKRQGARDAGTGGACSVGCVPVSRIGAYQKLEWQLRELEGQAAYVREGGELMIVLVQKGTDKRVYNNSIGDDLRVAIARSLRSRADQVHEKMADLVGAGLSQSSPSGDELEEGGGGA